MFLSVCEGAIIPKPNKRRFRATARKTGFIAHVGSSRSRIFWVVINEDGGGGDDYFGYGKHFLSWPQIPHVGWNVSFVALPPNHIEGRLERAIEIEIQKAKPTKSVIKEREEQNKEDFITFPEKAS